MTLTPRLYVLSRQLYQRRTMFLFFFLLARFSDFRSTNERTNERTNEWTNERTAGRRKSISIEKERHLLCVCWIRSLCYGLPLPLSLQNSCSVCLETQPNPTYFFQSFPALAHGPARPCLFVCHVCSSVTHFLEGDPKWKKISSFLFLPSEQVNQHWVEWSWMDFLSLARTSFTVEKRERKEGKQNGRRWLRRDRKRKRKKREKGKENLTNVLNFLSTPWSSVKRSEEKPSFFTLASPIYVPNAKVWSKRWLGTSVMCSWSNAFFFSFFELLSTRGQK